MSRTRWLFFCRSRSWACTRAFQSKKYQSDHVSKINTPNVAWSYANEISTWTTCQAETFAARSRQMDARANLSRRYFLATDQIMRASSTYVRRENFTRLAIKADNVIRCSATTSHARGNAPSIAVGLPCSIELLTRTIHAKCHLPRNCWSRN